MLTTSQLNKMPADVQAAVRLQLRDKAVSRTNRRLAKDMNSNENSYAGHLEGLMHSDRGVNWWAFEPVTFKLGADCRYTPDFMVITSCAIEFHEVKAWWEKAQKVGWKEDARVKIKAAAERYPWFKFIAVWHRPNIGWCWEEF